MTQHNPQAPTAALTLVREGSVRLLACRSALARSSRLRRSGNVGALLAGAVR